MASVGARASLPASPNREAKMAGLPPSLAIAFWLVGALWIVALVSNYFGFSSDLIWFVLFLGTGVALIEWRALRNK
jgi:hypothetical protein